MNRTEILQGLVRIYNRFEEEVEADLYLHEHQVDLAIFEDLKKEAKELAYQERLLTMPKRQKRLFAVLSAITLLLFALFFFLLPSFVLFSYKLWLSILGGVLISAAAFITWGLYKSWTPERIKEGWKFRLTGLFFVVLIIPATIIAGINWFVFDAAQSRRLREHHEVADAVVVYGQTISTRRADFTSITVQFRTKDGTLVTASESVPKSMFDRYYKGQMLKISYLPEDPNIISLLQSEGEARSVLGTEERRIRIADLITLSKSPADSIQGLLGNISYQWRYDKSIQKYVHEKNMEAINVVNGEVLYLSPYSPQIFKDELPKLGFRLLEENKTGGIIMENSIYESDSHRITVERQAVDNSPVYIYLLTKLTD
jgi:hypothetical protein